MPNDIPGGRALRSISRRQLLGYAGTTTTGLVGLALTGCGGDDSASNSTGSPAPGSTPAGSSTTLPGGTSIAGDLAWKQPAVIASVNGVLETRLTIEGKLVPSGNKERWAITVNGTSPGPTLLLRPGDTLRIACENKLPHSTNLHTHGLRVSPEGNADNPFIEIKAGETFDYEMKLPADHPSGMFWYHPHLHHHVAEQLFAGMFGAIVVEDALDELPEIATSTERLLLLHDTRDAATESGVTSATMMDLNEGREGPLLLVNGVAGQKLAAAPGTLERWRLLNASTSRFYRLKLDGHQLHVIARDGGRLAAPEAVDELTLVPGERAEVLVQPSKEGAFALRMLPISRGAMSAASEATLLTMSVSGSAAPAATLPAKLATLPSASSLKVTGSREVSLEMQMGGGPPRFLVSGKAFDANRIDTRVKLGTIEDWTVRNIGTMDHPFHLHIWPFLVLERSGGGPLPAGWKDVVNVPAGGFVKLRIPFEQIGGKSVYHCHILDHEDQGMMATIEAT